MRYEYTPAVLRALETAQLLAGRAAALEVLPTHLLAALLVDDESRVATLLISAGLDLAVAREALTPASPPEVATAQPVPLAANALTVLRAAREPAAFLSVDGSLTTDAVLAALLQREDDLRQLLIAAGLRYPELEQALFPTTPEALDFEEEEEVEEVIELSRPPLDQAALGRILDAVANRAREALRVLEDYCRFALNDRVLSSQLKQMRHDLATVLKRLPSELLLASRDTPGDVGTEITTESEGRRESLEDVARAACKRLQESLRSLEEFGKLHGPELGEAVEDLRYRGYTLEQILFLGLDARRRLEQVRLMVLVTESLCKGSLEWTIREAAAGGADMIQLREKDLTDRELLERARKVRHWTRQDGVLFVINDRPDVAVLAEADGVHLGQQDMRVAEARRIVGPNVLIGVSTANLGHLQQAVIDGASYVGVGPAFPSRTKEFPKLAGLEYVREATVETTLPAFVIGGVNQETVATAVAAGARRIAVSQAVCGADDPRKAVEELGKALEPHWE